MYQCTRCGYLSNRKGNLINHLKRKRICEPIMLDVSRSELLNELKVDNRRKTRNQAIGIQTVSNKYPVGIQKVSNKYPVSIQKVSSKTMHKTFACSFCNKTFKHKNNMYRHEKHRCKLNPNNNNSEELQNQLIELKKTIDEQQEQIQFLTKQQIRQQPTSTTNRSHNTNNNNINKHNTNSFNTVNVNLNTIGNENIEYLKTFLLKNIKNIIKCNTDFFIEYVKQKHFHPEHIENHNVVAFNQRSNSMYGYMNQDNHLERRLKNSMSLVLYKNIIDDVSVFLEKQLQRKKTRERKRVLLDKASNRMAQQEDAVYDYEQKDKEDEFDEPEKKTNIKIVDTHLKEIQNTIYNESKSTYGDISAYYLKHNEQNNDVSAN